MNFNSIFLNMIACGFAAFLFLLVSPAESKSTGRDGSGLPGGNRPIILKPSNKPSIDVSTKAFGSKKAIAFPAGAYLGDKVVNKVDCNPFLRKIK